MEMIKRLSSNIFVKNEIWKYFLIIEYTFMVIKLSNLK